MTGTADRVSDREHIVTLFSCQKNEGPHLLERIAYSRVIGFQQIVILSNDGADGSDAPLDVLAEHGIVEHHRHAVRERVLSQVNGARVALEKSLFAPGEWLMWLDPDEYLNIHTQNKRMDELIGRLGDADDIVANLKFFGNGGNSTPPAKDRAGVGLGIRTAGQRLPGMRSAPPPRGCGGRYGRGLVPATISRSRPHGEN